MRGVGVAVVAALLALLALFGGLAGCSGGPPDVAGLRPFPAVAPSPTATAAAHLDLSGHSISDPTDLWVVINKTHPITPRHFRPKLTSVRGYQVAVPVAGPLSLLLRGGDRFGFKIASAYRSYGYQVRVHGQLVASKGRARADATSARPGFSEHQAGLAVDLVTPGDPGCDFKQCFGRRPAGRWLAEHAWEYGFVVRYTAGNRAVTGYRPEPWHLRYVGQGLARVVHEQDTTLEALFHVRGGDYR